MSGTVLPSPPIPSTLVVMPSPALDAWVERFWVVSGNRDADFELLPDGVADLVVLFAGSRVDVQWYGTATGARAVPLVQGGHYVGIRFRPGRQRHLLRADAREITDRRLPAEAGCAALFEALAEALLTGRVRAAPEAALARQFAKATPADERFDRALDGLGPAAVPMSVEAAARTAGLSLRQFERRCLHDVGVSPRTFAAMCRFRRAAEALRSAVSPGLADLAADCGYADQSHMTRAFRLWAGRPPGAFRAGSGASVPMSHSFKTR